MLDIKIIAKEIHARAVEKGWYDKSQDEDSFIERMCNNLHDEVSELHEAWRNNGLRSLCDKTGAMMEMGIEPLTNLEEELADIIIRVLDNAEYLEVDIEKAVISKHAFNHTRKTRHGGKKS